VLKMNLSQCYIETTERIMEIWETIGLKIAIQQNIVTKLKGLVNKYKMTKKNSHAVGPTQVLREIDLTQDLEKLFDIAHRKLPQSPANKAFLEDQKTNRWMTSVDILFDHVEKTSIKLPVKVESSASLMTFVSMDCVDNDNPEVNDDFYNSFTKYQKQQFCSNASGIKNTEKPLVNKFLDSPNVAATCDRINISDRKFTMLLGALANAAGDDIKKGTLSTSSVRNRRAQHRSTIETKVRSDFINGEKPILTVHWDGKMMDATTSKENSEKKCERLAVIVTGLFNNLFNNKN
jgi:hypothetical protein